MRTRDSEYERFFLCVQSKSHLLRMLTIAFVRWMFPSLWVLVYTCHSWTASYLYRGAARSCRITERSLGRLLTASRSHDLPVLKFSRGFPHSQSISFPLLITWTGSIWIAACNTPIFSWRFANRLEKRLNHPKVTKQPLRTSHRWRARAKAFRLLLSRDFGEIYQGYML
jgi:hypothetical protein